jgi:hypothetical protein
MFFEKEEIILYRILLFEKKIKKIPTKKTDDFDK